MSTMGFSTGTNLKTETLPGMVTVFDILERSLSLEVSSARVFKIFELVTFFDSNHF